MTMKQLTNRQLTYLRRQTAKKLKEIDQEIKRRRTQNVPFYSTKKNVREL